MTVANVGPPSATASGDEPSASNEAKAGSRKTYLVGSRADVRDPMREVLLSTGDAVILYDTSGPYTDRGYAADVRRGLPALRDGWIAERGDTEDYDGRQVHPEDDGR